MKKKNIIGVLSIGAILGGLVSAGIPVDAKADIEAYEIKVGEDIYSYNKTELTEDFLNFKVGIAGELYKDFTAKLKMANGFHAFKDEKKGFIDYKDLEEKYLESKIEHKAFSVDKYVESKECKVIEVKWTKKAVMTKDGQVKYETPIDNDSHNKDKDTDNKENNKESDNKPKHKHTSSSSGKENKEEKKSDVAQKDDKKDQADKQKQEQLKKDQEAKAKAEKEKQEQQAKEAQLKKEQQEKEKQATTEKQKAEELKKQQELNKQKEAEQLKKEQEEKAKQEQLKKDQEAKAKQEQLKKDQEAKARAEKSKQDQKAKEEAERQKAEQLKKEQEEKAKQEQLKKDQEAKAKAEKSKQDQKAKEEAERQKAEQLKKEQEEKAKQEQLKKDQNNKLIEEAKNNINLGDLTNVKDNLTLPTKNANGVQITWKSSDQSVIRNDGTVIRPSADKGDKKVRVMATFTKDSVTSTKEYDVTVKAQENLKAKTEEQEIAELLKNDKKIEVTQSEKFDKVVKEAVKQLKPSFTVVVPYAESGKFNFNNFKDIMAELGGYDYGKPSISTSGGSVQIIDGKIPMTVQLNYMRDINEVRRQKKETEDAIKTIIAKVIKSGMTDVEKELALHDYVVENADYNMKGLNKNPVDLEDHSAYGVLVLGKGVCESYAKAMHLLLNEAGIECKYATGYKRYENGAKGGGHAWNMVKLDNEWYNLDATWDDPVSDRVGKSDKEVAMSPVIHTYFNVNDAVFNRDHIRGQHEERNYPAANGTKYSYDNLDVDEFMKDGKKVPTVASRDELIRKVKEAMQNRETKLYVRLKGFKMTQQELMNELGRVLDGNIYQSYGVNPTDSSHAYCYFVLR